MSLTIQRSITGLTVFVVAVAAVAVVGSLAAISAADAYQGLVRPSWAPPSWLFGPVWTILYVAIAVAGWLVWRAREGRVGSEQVWFGLQLVLNAAWTPLFFAAGEYGWALVDIVALAVTIVVVIVRFARIRGAAAWLMVPYLAWVLFATAPNLAIWRLN